MQLTRTKSLKKQSAKLNVELIERIATEAASILDPVNESPCLSKCSVFASGLHAEHLTLEEVRKMNSKYAEFGELHVHTRPADARVMYKDNSEFTTLFVSVESDGDVYISCQGTDITVIDKCLDEMVGAFESGTFNTKDVTPEGSIDPVRGPVPVHVTNVVATEPTRKEISRQKRESRFSYWWLIGATVIGVFLGFILDRLIK